MKRRPGIYKRGDIYIGSHTCGKDASILSPHTRPTCMMPKLYFSNGDRSWTQVAYQ